MNKTFRLTFIPLVISLVFGGVWFVIGGLMYNALKTQLWTPLLVALYITGLALFLFLAIIVSNALCQNAKPRSSEYQKSFIVIAAILLCSMLFEFLYELDAVTLKADNATSYIFLIDDSGSMGGDGGLYGNDPNGVRYDAIPAVLKDCKDDFPYAVYAFDHGCQMISSMAPASEGKNKAVDQLNLGGGTDIQLAIEYVLSDIDNGILTDCGTAPRILLLSDGVSYFNDFDAMINECNSRNVSVSTVGFGSAEKDLLREIAQRTGGYFQWAKNVSGLSSAMSTAIFGGDRDLLNERFDRSDDALLVIMRIVFMLILAAGFVLIKMFMFSTFDEKNFALYAFVVLAVVGALGLEIGIQAIRLDPVYMRALFCFCLAFLVGSSKEADAPNMGNTKNPYGGNAYPGSMGSGFAGASDKWSR